MGLIFKDIVPDIFTILAILSTSIYFYFKHAHSYWQRRKVPFLEPSIPLGNSTRLINKASAIGTDSKIYYDQLKKQGHKFGGIYTIVRPVLVVVDPDYVRDILQNDFQYFTDRDFYHNEKNDPISAHLFSVRGHKWKHLRTKLTPTFTSGKMKMMFNSILDCSKYMLEALDVKAANNEDIDILEVLASFTTDVIGICAFGINCNSFKYPDAEFRQMGKKIFERTGLKNILRFLATANLPELSLKLGLSVNEKVVSDFFKGAVESTIKMREENNIQRPDFLQLLIDMKNQLTLDEITAQAFLFFIAGFDTSSTAMNFTLYELAQHPDIQEKVRKEVNEVLNNYEGKITYESLNDMKYLSQVVNGK